MTERKRLSIILPSYNDVRIRDAIESIRRFDDAGTVRLVVIDGRSKPDTVRIIEELVEPGDIFVSEPDRGIFDALNKGLDRCTTEFVGWLGSDDLFTGQLLASDVIAALEQCDLLVANLAIFRDDRVRRVNAALPSRLGLARFGLHNPHYATFGRASLLKNERFETDLLGADIPYFLRIFARNPRVMCTSAIATLQREGGFSNRSYGKILRVNLELLSVYSRHTNFLVAPFAVIIKLAYKFCSSVYYRLLKVECAALHQRRLR